MVRVSLYKSLTDAAALAAMIVLALTMPAGAITVLDFEGLGDLMPIGNYYNGGAGPDYGVSFSQNALALIDRDAGGSGNTGGEPSPETVMFYRAATLPL